MSHFSRKSLIFYGVAISSVVLLFNGVARYGTAELKAPPTIDGHYNLELEPTAQCPQPESLHLHIQQSGIYVNAALGLMDREKISLHSHPLNLEGKLRSSQLDLHGDLSDMRLCGQSVAGVTIVSEILTTNPTLQHLTGQINFTGLPDPFAFSSQRQMGDGG